MESMNDSAAKKTLPVYDSKKTSFITWLKLFRIVYIVLKPTKKVWAKLILNEGIETDEDAKATDAKTYGLEKGAKLEEFEDENENMFCALYAAVDARTQRILDTDQERFIMAREDAKRNKTEVPRGQEEDGLRAVRLLKKSRNVYDQNRLTVLETEWTALTWHTSERADEFMSRVEQHSFETIKCGGTCSEKSLIAKVLSVLSCNERFDHFHAVAAQVTYESFETFQAAVMVEVRRLETKEKTQRAKTPSSSSTTALNTSYETRTATRNSASKCKKCQENGHSTDDCPEWGNCDHCGKYGHSEKNCYSKNGKGEKGAKGGRGRGRGAKPTANNVAVRNPEPVIATDSSDSDSAPEYVFNVSTIKSPSIYVSVSSAFLHMLESVSLKSIAYAAFSGIALFFVMLFLSGLTTGSKTTRHSANMTSHLAAPKIIIDSACTHHMFSDRSLFDTMDTLNATKVNQAGKGSPQLSVEGTGDVKLKLRDEFGKTRKLVLKNVYYVPTLQHNLLSTMQIRETNRTAEHVQIRFDLGGDTEYMVLHEIPVGTNTTSVRFELNQREPMGGCDYPSLPTIEAVPKPKTAANNLSRTVREHSGQSVTASAKDDLLRSRGGRRNGSTGVTLFSTDPTYAVWHARCGHLAVSQLDKLQDAVHDMKIVGKVPGSHCTCEICSMQKAHKRPFPKKSKHRAGSKLDLVHSDVQGPFDKSAVDGDRWAINFVDDHTRFTVVYTMKSKDEALKYFKHYCAQYGTPRCLRSDNGGEYTSHSFETFCLDKGIRQDLTVPHTPEQNGVAERSWRTLDEMARCMRHHANLTEEFWSYAINTAAYIRNRCLTNAHDLNTTPYEMFYGEKPSFEAMKVFGCTAYMHLNEQERYGKWDDKAEKGVLVGYSTRSKGWRIYVPRTDSVYVRRNVTFNENDFGEAYEDATNLDEGVLIPEEEQCLVQQHDDESDDEGNRTDPDTEREETPEREDVPEPIPAAQVPQPRYPSRNRNQAPLPCEMTPRDVANLTYTRDSYGDINSASAYMVSVNQKHRTPKSHSEVLLSDDTEKWLASEAREMKSHHDNGTWDYELVPLPNGKKAVGSKWVYKVKENSDGTVDVFKSRVVAQGFSQVEGVDFNETFAPTLRYTTLRTLLALASIMGYALGHLDVSTAYLYGELDEEIYMEQPKGYEKYGPNGEKLYCRLRKSLYGLKQAGRNWNILLDEFMKSFGFRRSEVDPCLYIFEQGSEYLAVAIYVDDLLTVTNSEKLRKRFTDAMSKRFKITDKGDLEWFLGMHVERHDGLITLDQQKYADDTAAKFNQSEAKSTATPANEGERLSKADCQQNAADSAEMKGIPFMNLVGSLIYFMVSTRPDIAQYP